MHTDAALAVCIALLSCSPPFWAAGRATPEGCR